MNYTFSHTFGDEPPNDVIREPVKNYLADLFPLRGYSLSRKSFCQKKPKQKWGVPTPLNGKSAKLFQKKFPKGPKMTFSIR